MDDDDMKRKPFIQLITSWIDHPEMVSLTLAEMGMWTWGLSYANNWQTDGYIPRAAALKAGCPNDNQKDAVAKLIQVGRWEIDPTRDGYQIVNYLKYNRSKEQIEALSEVRGEAGKLGGRPRKNKSENQNESKPKAKAKQKKPIIHNTEDISNNTTDFISVRDAFMAKYETAYGTKYQFVGGKDGSLIKKLLKPGLETAMRCIDKAFSDNWCLQRGCDLGLIVSQMNRLQINASNVVPIIQLPKVEDTSKYPMGNKRYAKPEYD